MRAGGGGLQTKYTVFCITQNIKRRRDNLYGNVGFVCIVCTDTLPHLLRTTRLPGGATGLFGYKIILNGEG